MRALAIYSTTKYHNHEQAYFVKLSHQYDPYPNHYHRGTIREAHEKWVCFIHWGVTSENANWCRREKATLLLLLRAVLLMMLLRLVLVADEHGGGHKHGQQQQHNKKQQQLSSAAASFACLIQWLGLLLFMYLFLTHKTHTERQHHIIFLHTKYMFYVPVILSDMFQRSENVRLSGRNLIKVRSKNFVRKIYLGKRCLSEVVRN